MSRIVVIGGGAAGAAVVGEYLRGPPRSDLSLAWVVGNGAPGRGVAYSTTADFHLLNVRAAGMGLFADDVCGFLEHLNANGRQVLGGDFVPREWFGDFAEATLAKLISDGARNGAHVELLSSEAIRIQPTPAGHYAVALRDGRTQFADEIVLALGGLPSAPLDNVSADAMASGAYLLDPWAMSRRRPPPREVVVIGTGLSGVDAALDAASRWPSAHITCVSRHGRLPLPHPREPAAPFAQQAAFNDALLAAPNLRAWCRIFRETLEDNAGDIDWRALVDGIRPVTSSLWRSLGGAERRRFLRHLRWLWEIARHRMPPKTAQALAVLSEENRLSIVAGRIRAIDGDGPLSVKIAPRGDESERVIDADLVVQATGFNTNVSTNRHRLLRQLIDEGLAVPDEFGLGLKTDGEGRLVGADDEVIADIRLVGTLERGALWECSGLPEIRTRARAIVDAWRRRRSPAIAVALQRWHRDAAAFPGLSLG